MTFFSLGIEKGGHEQELDLKCHLLGSGHTLEERLTIEVPVLLDRGADFGREEMNFHVRLWNMLRL